MSPHQKSKWIKSYSASYILPKDRPRTATIEKNCVYCARFSICSNEEVKNKMFDGLCGRFENTADMDSFLDIKSMPNQSKKKTRDFEFDVNKNERRELMSIIDTVLSNGLSMPSDARIDDSDFPQATNFWQFISEFVDLEGMTPFPKQLEMAIGFFQEYCPRCTNKDFIDNYPNGNYADSPDDSLNEILDNVVLLEHGVCPKCKVTKGELVETRELNDYNEFAGLAGQRGGKSALFGMMGAYLTHWWLKCPNPVKLYNLLPNSTLTATVFATTMQQAQINLWEPMIDLIDVNTGWFSKYHEMLDYYGSKNGEEFYDIKNTFIRYNHRRLFLHLGVPNTKTLRGFTRFLGAIDELDWFNVTKEGKSQVRVDGVEVHKSMNNSFRTLRSSFKRMRKKGINNLPPPMLINISSPSSYHGHLSTLYRKSQKSRLIYGSHYPTWEMNPFITKQELEEEFSDDLQRMWRDFGAIPPMSSSSFITRLDVLKELINPQNTNAISVKRKTVASANNVSQTGGDLQIHWHNDVTPKVLALDPGLINNSFAFSLAHLHRIETDWGVEYVTIFDALGEIAPIPGQPINYNNIYRNILLPICRTFNVRTVLSDRWQNIKILHDLVEDCPNVEQTLELRVRYNDFVDFRQSIYDNNLILPKCEISDVGVEELKELSEQNYPQGFLLKPVSHWLWQCLTVVDHVGRTVDKGENMTDDIFRATVLTHLYFKLSPDKELYSGTVRAGKIRQGVLGVKAGGISGNAGSSIVSRPNGNYSSNSGGIRVFTT